MRDKRIKFIDLAESQIDRVTKDIRMIGNLANGKSNEYSQKNTRKIARTLQEDLNLA